MLFLAESKNTGATSPTGAKVYKIYACFLNNRIPRIALVAVFGSKNFTIKPLVDESRAHDHHVTISTIENSCDSWNFQNLVLLSRKSFTMFVQVPDIAKPFG